ncbi:MAG: hypothetical protein RR614_09230 [Eubacterium sp.]
MKGARKQGEEGFSTKGKSFFKKGGLFAEDKSHDGELIVLRREVRKSKDEKSDSQKLCSYHTFVIQKGRGEATYVFKASDDTDFTEYFKEGELVRHHSGYEIPEKFDKSQDEEILCVVCGEFSPMAKNQCPYCGEILLK